MWTHSQPRSVCFIYKTIVFLWNLIIFVPLVSIASHRWDKLWKCCWERKRNWLSMIIRVFHLSLVKVHKILLPPLLSFDFYWHFYRRVRGEDEVIFLSPLQRNLESQCSFEEVGVLSDFACVSSCTGRVKARLWMDKDEFEWEIILSTPLHCELVEEDTGGCWKLRKGKSAIATVIHDPKYT